MQAMNRSKGNSKYKLWQSKDQLERITNWAATGCTSKELAHNIGVSEPTLCRWMKTQPKIAAAVRKGREMSVQVIENAMFRNAVGLDANGNDYEEITVREKKTLPDGSVETFERTTRQRIKPNTAAQIFFLKNRAGYRDNPPERPGSSDAPMDPLSEALLERAGKLDHGAQR